MNYNNNIDRGTTGIIRYSCSILVALFSLAYLILIQGELLSEAQFVFSKGLTRYSIVIGAVVIVAVMQLLQWVVKSIVRIPWRYYSLSYVPSLILLSLLTSFNNGGAKVFSIMSWLYIVPVSLALFSLMVLIAKRLEDTSRETLLEPFSLLWPNYLLLCISFAICGNVSSADKSYLYELKVERLIMQHDYEGALQVADRSLQSTQRLSQLRMFALAQSGQLAERLFDYPQYHRGKGLLCIKDTSSTYRYSSERICHRLGALPDSNTIHTTEQYLRVMNRIDSLSTPVTRDYYLCYLLLCKDMERFTETLQAYYPDTAVQYLPRAYREAILSTDKSGKLAEKYNIDTYTREHYASYCLRKSEITGDIERKNLLRKDFGNTFWWYFDF